MTMIPCKLKAPSVHDGKVRIAVMDNDNFGSYEDMTPEHAMRFAQQIATAADRAAREHFVEVEAAKARKRIEAEASARVFVENHFEKKG